MDRPLFNKRCPTLRRPAFPSDGEKVGNSLREDDRQEIEALGFSASMIPTWVEASACPIFLGSPYGDPVAVGGVIPDRVAGSGVIWMLCTPAISGMPYAAVREAREWLREISPYFWFLHNICDKRNLVHHKLLKHLGFRAIREVNIGPYNLPFYEIVKLCVPPPQ